jgi:putative membrane protein
MDHFLVRLLINAVAVIAAAWMLKGVQVKNFLNALLVALVLSLVNAILKPILIFLTIPVTIITLGLFLLVIDAILILLVSKLVAGFRVKNFGWAFLFGIVLSIINALLVWIL